MKVFLFSLCLLSLVSCGISKKLGSRALASGSDDLSGSQRSKLMDLFEDLKTLTWPGACDDILPKLNQNETVKELARENNLKYDFLVYAISNPDYSYTQELLTGDSVRTEEENIIHSVMSTWVARHGIDDVNKYVISKVKSCYY